MGKRTSDFLAIAAIVSGAGVGLGLTGLRAENGPVMVHDRDEATVRVQVRRGMRVEPGHISVRASRENGANVYMWRSMREDASRRQWSQRMRVDVDRRQLDELRAQARALGELQRGDLEKLRAQAQELGNSEALAELLEGIEGLESLELDLRDLTIDVQQEGDDEGRKRRRRRRPPRRMDRADRPSN
jgi:hypothetical protein